MLENIYKYTFLIGLTLLIPLWSIPNTIALRYMTTILLFITLFFMGSNLKNILKNVPFFLLLFFFYLFIQLLFSIDFYDAILNFKSEWLKFILFSLLGLSCGNILLKFKFSKLCLYLGLLWSIPLFLHLGLSLLEAIRIGAFPSKYFGINHTHGDLAYTSIHSIIFLHVYYLHQAKNSFEKVTVTFLIFLNFLSLLIAKSRGGILFAGISLFFGVFLTLFFKELPPTNKKRVFFNLSSLLVLILGLIFLCLYLDSSKKNTTLDNLLLSFQVDAFQISCHGIETYVNDLNKNDIEITPKVLEQLSSITGGDGARVVAARTALELIPKNIFGINQSKSAYAISLKEVCPNNPLYLSSSHNGWLDTALAIGVFGAILYFFVLITFLIKGIQAMRFSTSYLRPYTVALSCCALVWIFRSLLDSAQRDQMLEMQIFTLCLLYSLVYQPTNNHIND